MSTVPNPTSHSPTPQRRPVARLRLTVALLVSVGVFSAAVAAVAARLVPPLILVGLVTAWISGAAWRLLKEVRVLTGIAERLGTGWGPWFGPTGPPRWAPPGTWEDSPDLPGRSIPMTRAEIDWFTSHRWAPVGPDPDGEVVSLRDASSDRGIGAVGVSHDLLRKARQRDPHFPEPVDFIDDQTGLYRVEDLHRWQRERQGMRS